MATRSSNLLPSVNARDLGGVRERDVAFHAAVVKRVLAAAGAFARVKVAEEPHEVALSCCSTLAFVAEFACCCTLVVAAGIACCCTLVVTAATSAIKRSLIPTNN